MRNRICLPRSNPRVSDPENDTVGHDENFAANPLFLLWLALPATASDHTPPPVQPATSFPAVEVHADEQVAIAVEPYDTKEKESIFRVDYLSHDVMPVRLIVTNLGDRPISLRDARILFETAAGDRIQAAEPEDVERMMTRKERKGQESHARPAAADPYQAQGQQQGHRGRTSTPSSTRPWPSSRTPRARDSCSTMSRG